MKSAETGKWKSETGKAKLETGKAKLEIRNWKIGNCSMGPSSETTCHSRAKLALSLPKGGNPLRLALLLAVALLLSHTASGQVATGFPPFGSFGGGPFDVVNNANLNVHFAIPIIDKAGRGLPFDYAVSYDNSIWYPSGSAWVPVANLGWTGTSQVGTGYGTYSLTQGQCVIDAHPYYYNVLSSWYYYDTQGTSHSFTGLSVSNGNTTPCPSYSYPPSSASATVYDGSGWQIHVEASAQGYPSNVTVWSRSGVAYIPPLASGSPSSGTYTLTDPNGNVITFSAPGTYTDTLGTTVLSIQGTPSSGSVSYAWSPPGSGTGKVTFVYSQKTVRTNFGCSGISEYGAHQQYLVKEIDLPDNTKYLLDYETTYGDNHSPHHVTGRIASITLPTGGSITYNYSGGSHLIMCPSGGTTHMSRQISDGKGNNATWTYSLTADYPPDWETVVTDQQGNYTNYAFSGIYETSRSANQAGIGPLATVTTCYNGASPPCATAVTLPITEVTATTNLGGSVSETDSYYNSYGLLTKVDQYDFANGTHGNFLRETMTCYSSSFVHILDRASYLVMYSSNDPPNPTDCSGTSYLAAKTTYAYDGYGNLQTETRTNTGGSPTQVGRSFTYNSNGTLNTATDFNSHTTTYGYASGSASCNGSFPTTITPPISSLASSYTYNCNGGVVLSVTDPNSQTTTYKYTDPNFWRLKETDYPNGGITTIAYNDVANNFNIATARLVSSALGYHTVTQYLDGLGRIIKSQDNTAGTSVETTYDSLGRVSTVSNPHTGTSAPTDGFTTYGYDVLDRTTSVQAPDGSTTSTSFAPSSSYLTYCSTVTDPATKTRTLCSDGLGRSTSVFEDPSSSNYQTSYTYNLLDNLTGVNQGGQTRTYNYDMLSRLTSAATPEVSLPNGTQCSTTYGYDANGNMTSKKAPLPNQNTYCTDATHYVTTTYAYDGLNRLTSKTYSDSTPPANFYYDQGSVTIGSWSSGALGYPKGRMTEATTTASGSVQTGVVYSYDPVGRIKDFWQCTPANCNTSSIWDTHYNYDLAGDVTSWVHPGQFTLTNTVNSAQQVTAIQSSLTGANLPQTLAQSISYTPWGAVSQLVNGCVGTQCVNAQETYTYNNRLQPWMIELGKPGGGSNTYASYCLVYNYFSTWTPPTSCPDPSSVPTTGTTNNGNVMGYWYKDVPLSTANHKLSYGYDSLNRLGTAVATDLSNNVLWSQTYTYDRWGNMSCSGTGLCTSMSYNASNNNQISSVGLASVTYDAAGNLMQDSSSVPPHSYQWDAEGHIISIDGGSTASMTFNALGWRVYRTNGTRSYWVDPQGRFLGGYWGQWNAAIPFGGRTLAEDTNGTTGPLYFDHPNALGSEEQWTNWAGSYAGEVQFYPWGAKWGDTTNGNVFQYFASLQWYDPEVDGYQPPNRYEIPRLGRWLTPDPLAGDITNPQSLNRYAYALNNPCSMTDPLGLDACGFNVSINNQTGQNLNLGAIEAAITQIFDASSVGQPNQVGVSFGTSGQTDFTLSYNNNGVAGGVSGIADIGGNKGQVYANLYPASVYLQHTNTLLGVIGAHEMGHGLANVRDLPFNKGDLPTLMSIDNNPSWYTPVYNGSFPAGLLFTPPQVASMFSRCPHKHLSITPLPLGGGFGWSGPSWWQMWALYLAGNLGLTPEAQTQTNDHGPGSGWCPDCPRPTLTRR